MKYDPAFDVGDLVRTKTTFSIPSPMFEVVGIHIRKTRMHEVVITYDIEPMGGDVISTENEDQLEAVDEQLQGRAEGSCC